MAIYVVILKHYEKNYQNMIKTGNESILFKNVAIWAGTLFLLDNCQVVLASSSALKYTHTLLQYIKNVFFKVSIRLA